MLGSHMLPRLLPRQSPRCTSPGSHIRTESRSSLSYHTPSPCWTRLDLSRAASSFRSLFFAIPAASCFLLDRGMIRPSIVSPSFRFSQTSDLLLDAHCAIVGKWRVATTPTNRFSPFLASVRARRFSFSCTWFKSPPTNFRISEEFKKRTAWFFQF